MAPISNISWRIFQLLFTPARKCYSQELTRPDIFEAGVFFVSCAFICGFYRLWGIFAKFVVL